MNSPEETQTPLVTHCRVRNTPQNRITEDARSSLSPKWNRSLIIPSCSFRNSVANCEGKKSTRNVRHEFAYEGHFSKMLATDDLLGDGRFPVAMDVMVCHMWAVVSAPDVGGRGSSCMDLRPNLNLFWVFCRSYHPVLLVQEKRRQLQGSSTKIGMAIFCHRARCFSSHGRGNLSHEGGGGGRQ